MKVKAQIKNLLLKLVYHSKGIKPPSATRAFSKLLEYAGSSCNFTLQHYPYDAKAASAAATRSGTAASGCLGRPHDKNDTFDYLITSAIIVCI
jgi:hypothetical protein